MIRLLLGSIVTAVVLFVWGFAFWALSPLPFFALHVLPNEAEVVAALQKGDLRSGMYLSPWYSEEEVKAKGAEAMMKIVGDKQKAGPLVQVVYRREGIDVMNPVIFAVGFVHFLVTSFLLALLLKLALPGLLNYGARFLFVFLAGLFATVMMDVQTPIWFHHPWEFPLVNAAYHLGMALLAALVLAAFIRPQSVAPQHGFPNP